VTKDGIGCGGYDCVSYFHPSGPKAGLSNIRAIHKDTKYLFSNEDNREEFRANPTRFLPRFGGFCAKAVSEEDIFYVDPTNYIIDSSNNLLLFYKDQDVDTREIWRGDKPEVRMGKALIFWRKCKEGAVLKQEGGAIQPDA